MMRSKFDEQLDRLNKEMMKMGSAIEDSIRKAVDALVKQDAELAKKVMIQDEEIDREQKTIESICFNLLIQQQPVAKDLRTITAALKMVTDMERIGDQAADIRSIEAYVEKDMDKARKVIAYDDVVDDLFEKVRDDLIAMIQADSANGEQAADLLMVAKYFERIGDHATNIAEWVIFALDTKGGFDENASEHL